MFLGHLLLLRSDAGDGAPDEGFNFGDALRQARREDFHLDTYAMRALVFQTPQSVEVRIITACGARCSMPRLTWGVVEQLICMLAFRFVRHNRCEIQMQGVQLFTRSRCCGAGAVIDVAGSRSFCAAVLGAGRQRRDRYADLPFAEGGAVGAQLPQHISGEMDRCCTPTLSTNPHLSSLHTVI